MNEQDPTASMSADEADFARSRGQHVEPLQEPAWKLKPHVSTGDNNWRVEPWHPMHDFVTVDYLNALEAEVARLTPLAGLAEEAIDRLRYYVREYDVDYGDQFADEYPVIARYDALKTQEPS